MNFANRVARIAEEEGHHPDLRVSWGKCVVELWTHAINGLSENDFILAAKVEEAS
jgi:4a-hydroxytetrahydrobiopterin dehydratase